MAQEKMEIPGDLTENDKNRSDLQSIIQFSLSHSSISQPSSSKIPLTISARQTWSAHPSHPLTLCTRYTPLDNSIPGQDWAGSPLEAYLAFQDRIEGTWKPLQPLSGALRQNFQDPVEQDWQEKLAFVTLPSLSSGNEFTMQRVINISTLPNSSSKLRLKLDPSAFQHSPGIAWWNWGDLQGDLKGKKLGSVGDPKLNDKDREEERKKLDDDFELGYQDWRDVEDDEGNDMVWLEVQFDEGVVAVDVNQ